MKFPRGSGILLHPTSLPGPFGIGDLGPSANAFVDQLASARQAYWQILPLGPTGHGDSPYSAYSAFAGNTLLISPEALVADGLIDRSDLDDMPKFRDGAVDYPGVIEYKDSLLHRVLEKGRTAHSLREKLQEFLEENRWWLDDFAVFRVLRRLHAGKRWTEWDAKLALHDDTAIERLRRAHRSEIEEEQICQFLFFHQWAAIKNYANSKRIKIIGDIPIFLAADSADVWCNREIFKLDANGDPTVVAGVPPDYFSKTGQLWGNPLYDWEALRKRRFDWWSARVAYNLRLTDIVRLDHFIGFVRAWEVPAGSDTAESGHWVEAPGHELFRQMEADLTEIPAIAEDLGAVTDKVVELRDSLGFPGMKILQHAFTGDAQNLDLPHNYTQNCVAYTGTHDNDTVAGWLGSASKQELQYCRRYLAGGNEMHWEMIRAVMASVADTAIVPAQDLLGLGSEARMNRPATDGGNWQWRLRDGQLTDTVIARLREITETYGRAR